MFAASVSIGVAVILVLLAFGGGVLVGRLGSKWH